MKKVTWVVCLSVIFIFSAAVAMAAYHHEGENDAGKFLEAYPDKAGTKLDNCNLCHGGGSYVNSKDKEVQLGSCQWCHQTYGYDGAGDIEETMNAYGVAYKENGRNAQAVVAIDEVDSDEDGYTNAQEIVANALPGDANDYPGLVEAPYRVYTRAQLEALPAHTQFMLMNTSRSGDFYAEYTGVPMKDLLDDAGVLESATGVWVYAPDGWGQNHPLEYNEALDMYHVYGDTPGGSYQYPPSTYFYDLEADELKNPDSGWCDYSAPSCVGRSHGDTIPVEGGLKAILAYKRESAYMDSGVLNDENKLDGEGPFRVVVPQKYVNAPDQSSKSDNQNVKWPYEYGWDHNAGSCSRAATIVKIEPLPEGTTDIDILEAGWSFVDQKKIIVYGAIDGTDSNGNGILDSEEGTDETADFDGDGTPDYKDSDTASLRYPGGIENVLLHSSAGDFSTVAILADDDAAVPQSGKPDRDFPYGVNQFSITGLSNGESVTVSLKFPEAVPTTATYFKTNASDQWGEIALGSNDGDDTVTITLTDGNPATDGDGIANGVIEDPGALTTGTDTTNPEPSDGDDDDSSCFINALLK